MEKQDTGDLVVGKMYRIWFRYMNDRDQAEDRVAVMKYLGDDKYGRTQWSLRPLAGTQTLEFEELSEVLPVPDDTRVQWPHKVPK